MLSNIYLNYSLIQHHHYYHYRNSESLTLPILILLHLEDVITLQLDVEKQVYQLLYL